MVRPQELALVHAQCTLPAAFAHVSATPRTNVLSAARPPKRAVIAGLATLVVQAAITTS